MERDHLSIVKNKLDRNDKRRKKRTALMSNWQVLAS